MKDPGLQLKPIFSPDAPLLDRKFEEHRSFGVAMAVLCAFTAAGLWVWDRVVDSLGARSTLSLRLDFLALFLAYALSLRLCRTRWQGAMLGYAVLLGSELGFLLILERLRTGMVFGIGGFMFFFLIPLLLFQGFSLRVNLGCCFLAAALPHALALAGLAPGFRHAQYAVLIWPAAFLTAAAQTAFSVSWYRKYLLERRLEAACLTDPLTGVYNRRHFMPHLGLEMSRCRRFHHPLSLLMLDIDRFKGINDTFGHPTGDEVIRSVAEACRRRSRGSDIVARLGGEEFTILLPEASLGGAMAYAERIREDVEGLAVTPAAVRCTVSVGVAEMNPSDRTVDDFLRRADAALYRAKNGGRNRVCG